MQLLAYGGCGDPGPLATALQGAGLPAALYEDANDPQGVALLTFSEEPEFFVGELRRFLNRPPFSALPPKPEYTMFGRTYALGHEEDLEQALLCRPRQRVCNPAWPWAIWYPLRRAGSFEHLPAAEQRVILAEHGGVGRSFGKAGLGYDVRLACHGLGKNDNDFIIGLVGSALYPLSAIVQRMRKTRQTALHLERLGPFFVGRAVWQAPAGETPAQQER
ncbi:MAG: chlorite dismutase family protein [Candidatus Promineifilaceae bacterium]